MTDKLLNEQAGELAYTLRKLMTTITALHTDDPAIELPIAQIRVCNILREKPHPMSALSRELGISLSATTQIADRLERAGMVERVSEADDRRVKSLQLTSRGSELIRQRNERRTRRAVQVLEHLSPDVRDTVLCSLRTLLDACTQISVQVPDCGIITEQFD